MKPDRSATSRFAGTPALPQRIQSPAPGVEIWCAQLNSATADELADLTRLLDETERPRAEKFRFERDRRRFIVAHGLLRRVLSENLGQSIGPFAYGPNGKPSLSGEVEFNLSHSDEAAVFAISKNRRVGIDLESFTRDTGDLPAMAERVFSQRELIAWRALPDEQERKAAFFRAWTRKEACLKAAGARLDDMASIDVGFAGTDEPREVIFPHPPDDSSCRWTVHDLSLSIPFACALAVEARRVA